MSDKLKPCPFCGGEAEMREGSSTKPYIRCKRCGCRTGSSRYRGNLAKAWNDRADATDEQFAMAVHDGRVWYVVRECRNVGEETCDDFKCSLCGASYNESDDMAMPASRIDWCFSCGAKVVAE